MKIIYALFWVFALGACGQVNVNHHALVSKTWVVEQVSGSEKFLFQKEVRIIFNENGTFKVHNAESLPKLCNSLKALVCFPKEGYWQTPEYQSNEVGFIAEDREVSCTFLLEGEQLHLSYHAAEPTATDIFEARLIMRNKK